ncbi:hypothetical protein HanPSC8_Chr16g0720761 [Helianthus annuus]|nr:hypothetical protein HanPSC8_Chr16g0720761 [Helianthus annuus]
MEGMMIHSSGILRLKFDDMHERKAEMACQADAFIAHSSIVSFIAS